MLEADGKDGPASAPTPQHPLRCPITDEVLCEETAVLLADGYTYYRPFVAEWWKKNPTAVVGPMGIPLPSWETARNGCAFLPVDQRLCPLTLAPFEHPVVLFGKGLPRPSEMATGNHSQTYECSELVRGLAATWGKHETRTVQKFDLWDPRYVDLSVLDLSELLVMVPNRALWKEGPLPASALAPASTSTLVATASSGSPGPVLGSASGRGFGPASSSTFSLAAVGTIQPYQLPPLPCRPPARRFDRVLPREHLYGYLWTDEGLEEFARRNPPHAEEGSTKIYRALSCSSFHVGAHAKLYKFEQCHFIGCDFVRSCWCQVEFVACRFERCIWRDCDAKTTSPYQMFNCEYASCLVIATSHENGQELLRKLQGTQSIPPVPAADRDIAVHVLRTLRPAA